MIDTLQAWRMFLFWPLIVAALAWWLVFLWLENREDYQQIAVILATLTAAVAGISAAAVSRSWDDSQVYWTAFTAGLAGAVIVIWLSIVYTIIHKTR